jgi:hypothetical protein
MAEDTGASDALAVGYCRREPWARLDVQTRVSCGCLPDEAVGRPRVNERDEGSVYFSLQLKHRPSRWRSSCSGRDMRFTGCPSTETVGGAAFSAGPAGRAKHGGGGGRTPWDIALAAVGAYYSLSSSWRARLMAAARDCGLWTDTSRLSGGRSPPVNNWTCCTSSR